MHSLAVIPFLAGAVAAQSSAVLLNILGINDDNTVTFKGSDTTATTYENVCHPTSGGSPAPTGTSVSAQPTTLVISASGYSSSSAPAETSESAGEDVNLLPLTGLPPMATAKARLRRDTHDNATLCEPFHLIQGPSTWKFHLTDPVPGALTVDGSCHWTGNIYSTDPVTCTLSQDGSLVSGQAGYTQVFSHGELVDLQAIQTFVVAGVTGNATTGAPKATATPTPTGPSSPNGGSPGSGTGPQSSGLAPPLSLPTGAMAFVGGAAGLFAAVLAL